MSVCGVCEQLNQLNSELIRQLGAYLGGGGGGAGKDGRGAFGLPSRSPTPSAASELCDGALGGGGGGIPTISFPFIK